MNTTKIFIVILVIVTTVSCTSRYYTNKGVYHYDLYRYKKAIGYFEKAMKKRKVDPVAYLYYAKACVKLREFQKVASIIDQNPSLLENNIELATIYSRSVYLNRDKDPQAVEKLQAVQKKYPESEVLHTIMTLMRDTSYFSPLQNYNITEIKFPGHDAVFSPFLSSRHMYFTGVTYSQKPKKTWDGHSYSSIYKSQTEVTLGTTVIHSRQEEQLKNEYNAGTLIIDTLGGHYIFSANHRIPKRSFLQKNKVFDMNVAIYTVPLGNENKKTVPVPLPFIQKEYSYMHPALSSDGKMLYFSSNQPGGFGGFDLYYSEREGAGWSEPRNAGPKINTSGDEVFPYVVNNKLFFSSDRHDNMGGLDIFVSEILQKGVFGKPQNLKSPINSKFDDFGIFVNDSITQGYFSSNRSGSDKIYSFGLEPTPVLAETQPQQDTLITLEHEKPLMFIRLYVKYKATGQGVPHAVIVMNDRDLLQTDENGMFLMQVEEKMRYVFTAEQEGYYKARIEVTSPEAIGKDTIYIPQVLYLDKIEIEKIIVLENIYYDFDKWDIRPDAAIELDKLVQFLKDNPSVEIELRSHTDSRGEDSYNMILSKRRAESAVDYIIKQGIAANRITARYFGETQLLNHCGNGVFCPEELHQQNRRTEIKVTKIHDDKTKIIYSSQYFDYLTSRASTDHVVDGYNVASGDMHWHIVAGSFKYIENAQSFKKDLNQKGYNNVDIRAEPSQKFYRVTIGKYNNLANAIIEMNRYKVNLNNKNLWLLFE